MNLGKPVRPSQQIKYNKKSAMYKVLTVQPLGITRVDILVVSAIV